MAYQGPYIDLKNCDFFLEDGYTKTGAINNVAGYNIGATTIAVDQLTANTIIPPGVRLRITGDGAEYTVVSATGSPTTTSVVITPALKAAVLDNVVIAFGPNFLQVKIGDGNLTYSEKKPREYKKDRGKLDQVRDGDQMEMDVNFQFAYVYISSATGDTAPTFEEALKQKGPAADWVSVANECEPYCVNIVMLNNSNSATCGTLTEPRERTKLPKFYYEELAHDPKAGTVSATGKCNAQEAIVTRLVAA